jgi:hypothetical protein
MAVVKSEVKRMSRKERERNKSNEIRSSLAIVTDEIIAGELGH